VQGKAAFALPMTEKEVAFFKTIAGDRKKRVGIVGGRRGGKAHAQQRSKVTTCMKHQSTRLGSSVLTRFPIYPAPARVVVRCRPIYASPAY
jgi:hypothetical protein